MTSLIKNFIKAFHGQVNPLSAGFIDLTNLELINADTDWLKLDPLTTIDSRLNQTKYNLLFGSFPISSQKKPFNDRNRKVKLPEYISQILYSIGYLADSGTGIFLTLSNFFQTRERDSVNRFLQDRGFQINAAFEFPSGSLTGALQPLLIIVSQKYSENLFIGEIHKDTDLVHLIENFLNQKDSMGLEFGTQVLMKSFSGFNPYRFQKQINQLKTQFKEYDTYQLEEISLGVNSVKTGGTFSEKQNACYIPIIGNSPVVTSLSETKLKHQNYFQVIITDEVSNSYVSSFLNSSLGNLIRRAGAKGAIIPRLTKLATKRLLIAIPSAEEQLEIVETYQKLKQLREALDLLSQELALNPTNSAKLKTKLDVYLEEVGSLSQADHINAIIRSGESKTVEFKQTFSIDIRKGTKEKYIELASLKTIAAFLNSDGGDLLVGVSDDHFITGLEEEINKFYKSKNDEFLLKFKNAIKAKIGEQFYPFIDYWLISVNRTKVLWVHCIKSDKPCFIDGKDFYVRTNPATDKIEGPKLVEYVRSRFE